MGKLKKVEEMTGLDQNDLEVLRLALKNESENNINLEPGSKEQQASFDRICKGTELLMEVQDKELQRKHNAQQNKKERVNKGIIETLKVAAGAVSTFAVMKFTAAENAKSRAFETGADYMSSVSRSTNKLVQSIGEGLKNVFKH